MKRPPRHPSRLPPDQAGFVPLLILVLLIVGAAIYFVYSRVVQAQS